MAVGANQGLFAAAKLSRWCNATLDYPVSTQAPTEFVDSLLNFVRAHSVDLVVPVTDWTTGPLSAARDSFAAPCRIALPSQSALDFVSDKHRTVQLAASLGIDTPAGGLIASLKDLDPWRSRQLPLVLKDRFSVRWLAEKTGGKSADEAIFGSVAYAGTAEELERKAIERLQAAGDFLVQEFISGVGVGFACFVAGGRAYLPFQWQRIREVDPRGSASSARKSIPLDPSVVDRSVRLVNAMGFEGIAMVEYKRTAEGRLVLMEVNGRPWGSIGLPIACGLDYPRHLIDWSLNGKLPPEEIAYRENILCRRFVAELTHLSNLRAGRPANWPGSYPSFWKSLFTMALPWRPGMCYDDLWLTDLRPGIAGIREWLRPRIG